MNDAKHTKGPWTLETVRTHVGVCHKIGKLGTTTKLNYACLYDDCYSAEPRDLQLLADANLIAAAPDLLEALHGALFFVPLGTNARTRADAAIAKAEGR